MTKTHWTKTEEGRAKMREIAKNRYNKAVKRKYTRKPMTNGSGGFAVIIDGPDSKKALGELLSNVQYDKLNVNIMVIRKH